ncbi:MAG: hypothetical protein AB7F43_04470 [Bacteriovoracia bacterium]
MKRKIDSEDDKNFFVVPEDVKNRARMSNLLMEELPKTAELTLTEARRYLLTSWLNSDPLLMGYQDEEGNSFLFLLDDAVKSKILLLHFWDYTNVQSVRELDYIKEWHTRYSGSGLLIVGVHCPMFSFGKERDLLQEVLREQKIEYPVALDSSFALWKALENRCWPRRALFDPKLQLYSSFEGEGDYQNFELKIQTLLRQLSPGLACPLLMGPLRSLDQEEAMDLPCTNEMFMGWSKKQRLGNQPPLPINYQTEPEEQFFDDEKTYLPELPYFGGHWTVLKESIFSIPKKNVKLPPGEQTKQKIAPSTFSVQFTGTDVYVVGRKKSRDGTDSGQPVRLTVTLDRKAVLDDTFGKDMKYSDARKGEVLVKAPKLYHLLTNLPHGAHEITVQVDSDFGEGLELFAIYFSAEPPKQSE